MNINKLTEKYVGEWSLKEGGFLDINSMYLEEDTYIYNEEGNEKSALMLNINVGKNIEEQYVTQNLKIIVTEVETIDIARRYLTNAGFNISLAKDLCKDIAKTFKKTVNLTFAGNVEEAFLA